MAVFTVGGAANKCPLRPTLSNCELCIAALVLRFNLVFRLLEQSQGSPSHDPKHIGLLLTNTI